MKRFAWILGLLCLLLCSCSNSEKASAPQESSKVDFSLDSLSGMLRVKSAHSEVVLGTDAADARLDERPRMKVVLDYDFSIGRHEVTCAEFNALMKESTGLSLECAEETLPATNVTYYDAVLWANARSKAEGFDTAYTYSKVVFDSEKHAINLEGFSYNSDVNAYRLPTEAEWVLVASSYWNSADSWTAENSGYKLHKVCEKADSTNHICDVMGNAMEWVNDWLGHFRDTTVSNYVGAPDGGALDQRVVKGGSYRNSSKLITLYGRGDVYTVTSSTRADYVGFRLAFGAIPDAVWMNSDGKAVSTRVVPLASSATLNTLVATNKVKLAFRNNQTGNLAYIDYSKSVLSVIEIEDSLEVYHPEISPDGMRVAFCTGLEGVSGKSELYVRDLNENGSGLVKLNVESAAIPRWRVLESGDTVIVYVTDAGDNKSDFQNASTWQIKFANGRFGTPQKLFDGAYHDGISSDNRLAVSGARLLRARIAINGSVVTQDAVDTVWYKYDDKAEQACNASLSRDGSKRTLFLDFGGKTGRDFVGEKYGTHERLLIADSLGKLIQSVAAPMNYSFDHSEWILGETNAAVATLTSPKGLHPKIVFVDLSDNSIVELAESEDVWHPSLWVKSFAQNTNVSWNLDSIGEYKGNTNQSGLPLYQKMQMLWEFKDSAEVVGLGNSHMWADFDPRFLKKVGVNLGIVPCDMHCVEYLFDHYIINHFSSLKYVVVGLDLDLWYNEDAEKDINAHFGDALGFKYDMNHDFWPQGVDQSFVELVQQKAVAEPKGLFEERGCFASEGNEGWVNPVTGQADILNDTTWSDNHVTYEGNLKALENLIASAENHNVTVIGVTFPISPYYKNTGAYGRHGMRRSHGIMLIDYMKKLDQDHSNFILMDENKLGNHDYTNEMALDYDHLNKWGAEQISRRIDSLLNTLE